MPRNVMSLELLMTVLLLLVDNGNYYSYLNIPVLDVFKVVLAISQFKKYCTGTYVVPYLSNTITEA